MSRVVDQECRRILRQVLVRWPLVVADSASIPEEKCAEIVDYLGQEIGNSKIISDEVLREFGLEVPRKEKAWDEER